MEIVIVSMEYSTLYGLRTGIIIRHSPCHQQGTQQQQQLVAPVIKMSSSAGVLCPTNPGVSSIALSTDLLRKLKHKKYVCPFVSSTFAVIDSYFWIFAVVRSIIDINVALFRIQSHQKKYNEEVNKVEQTKER
jgi:hypothetical protein